MYLNVNNSTIRVLWVFIFGFGVGFSVYLSVGILNKFYYSPVSEFKLFKETDCSFKTTYYLNPDYNEL